LKICSVEKPDVPPLNMPARFRTEIVYFMTPSGESGVPALGPQEYWIRREDAQRWLDEFVVEVVSPLDAEAVAEIELSEEHEAFLQWLIDHDVQHVRIE
jgi:hypothetical protein